ncbi:MULTISPECIES: TRAP transporter permease [Acinetobacter]|uniref:TRAP transporter permease n=1 Tax=Acinetobacter variabilis TaxID=70346 RepID=A0A7T7WGT6_9GAMM|nr:MULTISPECIES: TRAP transporter permease [Acinetobacter]NHB65208.1 TRAP transporter permease [Acinetobacter sp. GFQ9D191M]NHC01745.1 TRAP transporter permease [Acinetobacter sp. GFQ9D192M]QQN87485.1 TRAP transporter permease [Acinetobacter variabilis]WKT73951.1 TRAP transporter permease [Acinetobacter variabilis]WPC34229.1 TRAP transporter permease [Acinetobacter sp. YWS30-1]
MNPQETRNVTEALDDQQQQELLEKFDRESVTRNPINKSVRWFIAALAISYSLFHLYITFNPLPELIQRAAHVSIGLALIFLLYPARQASSRQKVAWTDWIWVIASFASFFYLFKEYQAIMTTRGGIPNTLDIVFSIMTVVLVVEAARRVMGWMLPILGLIFLSYPFVSHFEWMPDRLLTRPYTFSDIFGQMYLKTEGLYSSAIGASVTFIFLFILFGAFLAKSGMGKLFNDLAMALAGHKQGGPAKVAVISSGFMGSINGTAVANVVGTGSFTIPLMKKIGYHKNFAGAVEASASVGGQILPPVMGASAFIMAETTGVSYGTIALAAVLPALLYYLGVMAQVHFRAGRDHLKGVPKADLPRVKEVLKERGHLLFPIVALVFFLFQSIPVSYAAVYTILLTIVVAAFRKSTRMGPKEILEALADGAKQSLSVMAACAVVGIIIGVVSLTSFGSVMTSSIMSIGAGSLFLTLFFTMIASMILGMGLPSIPAYIITATMAAPALANFDIPILVAHMFVFYFGLFANITPPVALAAFAGAGIAGGDPMRTGFLALRLSLAGFIVPFLFVYNPAMLMIDTTDIAVNAKEFALPAWNVILSITVTSIVGILALGAAVEGYFKTAMNWFWRIFLGVGALMMIVPETMTDIIGTIMVIIAIGFNIIQARKENTATTKTS